MRRSLRFVVVAITALLLVGVFGLVARSLWRQKRNDLLRETVELIPGVAQHIQNFRRVKVKDGRRTWEVAATDAQLFEADNLVVIRGAVLKLYLENGKEIGLESEEGRLLLDGREVKKVELRGRTKVVMADYTLQAEDAEYDDESERISVPGAVRISSARFDLTGKGMEVDVNTQRMRLSADVSMQIRSDGRVTPGESHAPL